MDESVEEGGTDKQISAQMHISMSTLRTHVQHIYGKLNVGSRSQFCRKAYWE